jgi:hypothetical protein
VFTVFLIYGFVPVVLLSLWGRFINHQQFESIFPAAAIIIAVQTIAPEYKRSTVMRIVAGLFSATIVAVSFASVPKFRNSHILAYTWVYAVKAGHLLGTPAGGVAVSLAVCAATMYLGASSLTSLLKALPKSMPSYETRSRTAKFIEWLMPNSLFRTIVLYFIRGK